MSIDWNARAKLWKAAHRLLLLLCVLFAAATCGGAERSAGARDAGTQYAQAGDLESRIRSKSAQVRKAAQAREKRGEGVPAEVISLTREVEPLLAQGKGQEAEAALDRALFILTGEGGASGGTRTTPSAGGASETRNTTERTAARPRRRAPGTGKVGRGQLGLMPNAPDGNIGLIPSGFQEARRNGVEVLYWYFSWHDLAKSWNSADFVMKGLSEGGKTAITFEVIHTTVQANYPAPFRSFDDPGFADAFSSFAAEFVERYSPDYVFVGNEANDYLREHPNLTKAYENVVRVTANKIRQVDPNTRVGVTIAYKSAKVHNQFDLVKSLASEVDLIGYTVYGYEDPDFRFKNPSDGIRMLEGVGRGVPGKPYAIVETGWNSSPKLGSSEAMQAEYVGMLFDYLKTTDAEFVNWFIYQDGKDCTAMAKTFLPPGVKPSRDKLQTFKDFLCNFGLKRADGRPKQAWNVWQERVGR